MFSFSLIVITSLLSRLSHTLFRIAWAISSILDFNLCLSCVKLFGIGEMYTFVLMKPKRYKWIKVWWPDRGGQWIRTASSSKARPIHILGRLWFKKSQVSRAECGGAPSCWETQPLGNFGKLVTRKIRPLFQSYQAF